MFYRPFCKWVYPLGAFYGLMNKVVLLGVEVDRGKCVTVCPVDALAYGCGFGGSDAVPGGVQWEKQQQQGTKQSGRGGCHVSGADGTGESDFCKEQEVVGKPIVGSITSDEQKKAPNDLIEQAMKKVKNQKEERLRRQMLLLHYIANFSYSGWAADPTLCPGCFTAIPMESAGSFPPETGRTSRIISQVSYRANT